MSVGIKPMCPSRVSRVRVSYSSVPIWLFCSIKFTPYKLELKLEASPKRHLFFLAERTMRNCGFSSTTASLFHILLAISTLYNGWQLNVKTSSVEAFCPSTSVSFHHHKLLRHRGQALYDSALNDSTAATDNVHGEASVPLLLTGRVVDLDQWVLWSEQSLQLATAGQKSILAIMDVSADDITRIQADTRFALLSHGIQSDPVYNYFNKAALQQFLFSEPSVYSTPSRYSAPSGIVRSSREEILQASVGRSDSTSKSENRLIVLPNAVRQKKSGQLFRIPEVLLWNVYNDEGERVGQTAIFDTWTCKDISVGEFNRANKPDNER
jgi:MEKHLA domain